MESCRPETVTYTAISSCQSVRRTTCCGLIAHNEQMHWVTSHSIEAEGKLIGLVLRRTGVRESTLTVHEALCAVSHAAASSAADGQEANGASASSRSSRQKVGAVCRLTLLRKRPSTISAVDLQLPPPGCHPASTPNSSVRASTENPKLPNRRLC